MGRTAYRTYHIYLKQGRVKESRPIISVQNPSEITLEEYRRRFPEDKYDYEISKYKLPDAASHNEDIKWTSRKYATIL